MLHKPDIPRDALSSVADNQTGSNIWLKHWSETNNDIGENPQVAKFIGVYVAFGLGSAVLVLVQSMILWLACSIKVRRAPMVFETPTQELPRLTNRQASRTLHERMVFAVFRSPMGFFEQTPAGQILNRFSRYVETKTVATSY